MAHEDELLDASSRAVMRTPYRTGGGDRIGQRRRMDRLRGTRRRALDPVPDQASSTSGCIGERAESALHR